MGYFNWLCLRREKTLGLTPIILSERLDRRSPVIVSPAGYPGALKQRMITGFVTFDKRTDGRTSCFERFRVL